jgi:hypothetical protein
MYLPSSYFLALRIMTLCLSLVVEPGCNIVPGCLFYLSFLLLLPLIPSFAPSPSLSLPLSLSLSLYFPPSLY